MHIGKWTCLVALLIVGGAGSGALQRVIAEEKAVLELNRESAALLLQRPRVLPPVTYEIPIGADVNVEDYIKASYSVDKNMGQIVDNSFGCLSRLGYLKIVPRQIHVFGSIRTRYDVSVTDKGHTIGTIEAKHIRGYNSAYVFKACDRVLVDVSGIKRTSDSSAVVEFRWQQGNPNEVYRCMLKPNTRIETGIAVLGKYDDGWRVENVKIIK